MKAIQLYIYTTSSGKRPFSEWLNKLDSTDRAIIRNRIARFRLGNLGDVKRLKNSDIWEARIDRGPGYRIYFARNGDEIVVLLAGGDKSSQIRDIERAMKFWLDWKEPYYEYKE